MVPSKKLQKINKYDAIVIGAGHAGCEAALAASRLGCDTLFITSNVDTIGAMSCNPAIGGIGKSQLVKEIDALGGEMAKAADFSAIQYRVLNSSRGPAVRSTRVQIDRPSYKRYMINTLAKEKNLHIKQDMVEGINTKNKAAVSVATKAGQEFYAKAFIICPGTFLNGLIHIGLVHYPGGRLSDDVSLGLPASLKKLGFKLGRLKTGTTARIDRSSVDFSKAIIQRPDMDFMPFSFLTKDVNKKFLPCFITYTNRKTHKIITDNLKYSPLYTGVIKAAGVRYCPSIEDKIVKFKDKQRHQIFLEPEGLDSNEIYPNGLSTSLPMDVQLEMLRSIEGLENARIIRPGYGIEHDFVFPTQLKATLETKNIKNLFLAGQINGTTGYEEAAAQGLVAGINAACLVKRKPAFVLGRDQAYIGVLIDDLVTKGTNEPYRMFTSRVEHRLILREDNADIRLTELGHKIGLVSKDVYNRLLKKKQNIDKEIKILNSTIVKPSDGVNKSLIRFKTSPISNGVSLASLLKRPAMNYQKIKSMCGLGGALTHSTTLRVNPEQAPPSRAGSVEGLTKGEIAQVEIGIKYEGFIKRSLSEIQRFRHLENIKIPDSIDYKNIHGLSREVKEKLDAFRPVSLGHALRISGITPAAISILMIWLKKYKSKA